MTPELLEDVITYERELSSIRAELGRLAADLAVLARQVADLRRDWPQDSAHLAIVCDGESIN